MSAGLNVSAKGGYLAAPTPVETMCQAETREKYGSPGRNSGSRAKCQAPGTDSWLSNNDSSTLKKAARPDG